MKDKMKQTNMLITLFLSCLIIINSSWSLSTYIRLKNAQKKYRTKKGFYSACSITHNYLNISYITSIIILIVSTLVLLITLFRYIRADIDMSDKL